MYDTTNIKFLARDEFSGRYFWTTVPEVSAAAAEANEIMLLDGDVDLNVYYDRVGLEPLAIGQDHGWSGDPVSVVFGSALAGPNAPRGYEGTPIFSLTFRTEPKPSMAR